MAGKFHLICRYIYTARDIELLKDISKCCISKPISDNINSRPTPNKNLIKFVQ